MDQLLQYYVCLKFTLHDYRIFFIPNVSIYYNNVFFYFVWMYIHSYYIIHRFLLYDLIWICIAFQIHIYGTHGLYSLGVMHDTRYCVHCCTRNGISCSVLRFNHVNKSCYWRLKIHSIHILLLNAIHSQKILYMWLVVLRAWYMTWWLLDTRFLNVRNFTQCTV